MDLPQIAADDPQRIARRIFTFVMLGIIAFIAVIMLLVSTSVK